MEFVYFYLFLMVVSFFLIGCEFKCSLKVLCIGVGGGGLVSFLKLKLGFEVMGVEMDFEVVSIVSCYFGLEESFVSVYVGDGVEFLKSFDDDGSKFDVLMVDVDFSDLVYGVSVFSVEFVGSDVLVVVSVVFVLCGVLVINVIFLSKMFYEEFKDVFSWVFVGLYEIDVGNGENFVFIVIVLVSDGNSGFSMENLLLDVLKYVDVM